MTGEKFIEASMSDWRKIYRNVTDGIMVVGNREIFHGVESRLLDPFITYATGVLLMSAFALSCTFLLTHVRAFLLTHVRAIAGNAAC